MTEAAVRANLQGLHQGRVAVAAVVLAVALSVDAVDPVPGRRLGLLGLFAAAVVLTAVYGVVARRSAAAARRLVFVELFVDVGFAAVLVGLTGDAAGPFVLLFPLTTFIGGMLTGFRGGTALGILAAGGFVILTNLGLTRPATVDASGIGQMISQPIFFVAVGMLAGLLGDRLHASESALAGATQELENLRLDTESIIQNLSSGLVTVDREGRIVHVNHAAETLLETRAVRLRGRLLSEALGGAPRELVDKIETTLKEGIPLLRAEVRLERPDGVMMPVGISTSVLKGAGGDKTGVVALFQDLTEVRRLEAASRRQDRLSVIGGMAASIAHEVRNCVNPISGSVEMLQQELQLTGENAGLLDLIAREAARMERFVSELLNFSRGNPIHLKAVAVEEALGRTIDKIRRHPAYRPTIAVRRSFDRGPTFVQADPEQLEQVFFNVALNALEAMGPVGSLTVSVAPPGEPGRPVVVEFLDTGAGMSRETLDRIFEPFYTTKGSGTGLGLAVAHRIVERHEGLLEVMSRPGSGTRVRVSIPAADSGSPAADAGGSGNDSLAAVA